MHDGLPNNPNVTVSPFSAKRTRHHVDFFCQLPSGRYAMMPDFAGVEKFFAHMTFKTFGAAGHSCRTQFSTRRILSAKLPEPGGECNVERRGQQGEQYIDTPTGDIKSKPDSRAHCQYGCSLGNPVIGEGLGPPHDCRSRGDCGFTAALLICTDLDHLPNTVRTRIISGPGCSVRCVESGRGLSVNADCSRTVRRRGLDLATSQSNSVHGLYADTD